MIFCFSQCMCVLCVSYLCRVCPSLSLVTVRTDPSTFWTFVGRCFLISARIIKIVVNPRFAFAYFCFFCFVFIFRCFWNLISNYYKLFIFKLIWINSLLFNYGCFYISSGKIGISLSKTLYTSGQSISWSVEFKPCFSEKYCISS